MIELPKRQGPGERALNIKREASYFIAVKNPEAPTPRGLGLDPSYRARFPKRLMQKFKGRRFIPVDRPAFLDYEGAQLVLIGASADPEKELGTEFKPESENLHKADVLKDLKLPREIAREPLLNGEWK